MTDAVIVSTARTPIGKAYRGAFNDTPMAPTLAGHAIGRRSRAPASIRARSRTWCWAARMQRRRDRRQHRAPGADPRRAAGDRRRHDDRPPMRLGPAGDRACRARASCSRRARSPSPAASKSSVSCRTSTRNTFHAQDPCCSRAQARGLHADDRHGRRRRRSATACQPRGAGRLRARKPAPHRGRAAGRPLRRRDRAAVDHQDGVVDKDTRRSLAARRDADAATKATAPTRRSKGSPRSSRCAARASTITAGNASQLSDGASACVVMERESSPSGAGSSRSARSAASPSPAASPTRWASVRSSPCRKLLARHGLKVDDIDLWELNEAFAVQVIYCRDRLGIDRRSDSTSTAARSPSAIPMA